MEKPTTWGRCVRASLVIASGPSLTSTTSTWWPFARSVAARYPMPRFPWSWNPTSRTDAGTSSRIACLPADRESLLGAALDVQEVEGAGRSRGRTRDDDQGFGELRPRRGCPRSMLVTGWGSLG